MAAVLPKAGHTLLFNHIANLYGGDAVNDFALPDVRGRLVIGDDGVDRSGSWPIAKMNGSNETVLGVSDIPAHTHTVAGGATGSTGGIGNTAGNYQPSLVMHWIISFAGIYPTESSGMQFPCVGEMRLLAAGGASGLVGDNWKVLDGAFYQIDQAEALFSLIGTTYGGDAEQTFGVPDMRTRVNMMVEGNRRTRHILGFRIVHHVDVALGGACTRARARSSN